MNAFHLLLVLTILFSSRAKSEDCTFMWTAELSTDPNQPKGLSGDTSAAYALFSFRPERNLKFLIAGTYPSARFFSFETYQSRLLTGHASIFDQQINPVAGYRNPVRTGVFEDGQYYNLEVLPDGAFSSGQAANELRLPNETVLSRLQSQTVMLRIYEPSNPLSRSDLPRIFAYDSVTGQPRRCPEPAKVKFYFDFPQLIGGFAPRHETLNFGRSGDVSGGNSAVPGYSFILTVMNADDIGLFKVKIPPARYASLCIQNFLENQTLACLPDRAMRRDAFGNAYIAFSENPAALQLAAQHGWSILPFARAPRQRVFGIVYRNILPEIPTVYEGEYAPTGILCRTRDFSAGRCRLPE